MNVLSRRLGKIFGALPPRSGAIILGYHQIADPAGRVGGDPYTLCVSPEIFARQMAAIRTLGRPVSLTHLARSLAAGVPVRGMIAVTFDDAYESVLTEALPVLQREEIPATVFFVSDNEGQPFWWDRLVALLDAADPATAFRLASEGHEVGWIGTGSRRELSAHLHERLSVLPESSRREVLDRLVDVWGLDGRPPLPRAMTTAQARTLLASRWIEAGAHSATHPPLAEIPPDRAREEIRRSRAALRDRFDREIAAFSFPHGSHDEATRGFVREEGFAFACSTRVDSVRSGTDAFSLPRFWPRDDLGLSFQRLRLYVGSARARGQNS